jgi:hypothetical protein
MVHLAGQFLALARTTSVPTPKIVCLYPYFAPETPFVPDGRAEIPLQWGSMLAVEGVLVTGIVSVAMLLRLVGLQKRKGDLSGNRLRSVLQRQRECAVHAEPEAAHPRPHRRVCCCAGA